MICFYHKNCSDGICAAYVVRKRYPDAICIPIAYGEQEHPLFGLCPPKDAAILMVDFSLPRADLIALHERYPGLIVIDHHKTAQKDLEGLPWCIFDMAESGASLTWKVLFPDTPLPRLVQYVADWDLWKKDLPDSELVNAFIQSYPKTVEAYADLDTVLETDAGLAIAKTGGASILRFKQNLVQQICEHAEIKKINGHRAAVVNTNVLMSEVGNELAKRPGVDFGAYYFKRGDGMIQWGARSIGDFDVSEVAKAFGGGGHKNAAGWQTP